MSHPRTPQLEKALTDVARRICAELGIALDDWFFDERLREEIKSQSRFKELEESWMEYDAIASIAKNGAIPLHVNFKWLWNLSGDWEEDDHPFHLK